MNVSNFKAGALTRQTARAECGNTTLVRDLGQRVVLVHELGKLAGTEELLDRRRNRFGVDQVLRHQAFAFCHGQTLFDSALDTDQTNTELVLGHLAYATNATVTEVVDVIDDAFAVTDINEGLEDRYDVFLAQHARTFDFGTTDTTVELHTTYSGQVITLRAEEQVVEQCFSGILGWRLARTHHAIDLDQRFQLVAGGVDLQCVGDERTTIDVVGVQRFDTNNLSLGDLGQDFSVQLGVALGNDLTGCRMHDDLGCSATQDVVQRHFQLFDPGLFQLVDVTSSDTTTLLDNDLALVVQDVQNGNFTTQALRHQFQAQVFTAHMEYVGGVERIEHLLGGVTQSAQKYGRR